MARVGISYPAVVVLDTPCVYRFSGNLKLVILMTMQFTEFIIPSLTKQCDKTDNTLYHLDGVSAIKHLDALLEIKSLNAIQWMPGAGQNGGGSEQWYPIYEKIRNAGKALWIYMCDGDTQQKIEQTDAIVQRFGVDGLYFVYDGFDIEGGKRIMDIANTKWTR